MPYLDKTDAAKLINRRHPEWSEHQRRWRWLQDSYEAGNRYRYANYVVNPLDEAPAHLWFTYGFDVATSAPYTIAHGQYVDANLVPHLSEMDQEGRALYALRLERTPVPALVRQKVQRHLARVYSREVQRTSPDPRVEEWWADVDGQGTKVDRWMRKVVGPLLMTLGQVDLCFDRPRPPEGATVGTDADARRYGLGKCVAGYVLPENLVWWDLEPGTGRYREVLLLERRPVFHWRHWTATDSNAYSTRGEWIAALSRPHPYGRVPIVRVFDERVHRCEHVGQSRFEEVAEYQKAIYNSRSELILGDVLQSNPLLQGPSDSVKEGGISVGPDRVLAKFKTERGGSVHYEGWEYVDPPKAAQQEIRQHVLDFGDEADRSVAMLKPAGATTRGAVAQSGVSKMVDTQELNDLLSEIAETLADAETACVGMVALVASGGRAGDADGTTIAYPREFGLQGPEDLAQASADVRDMADSAGELPATEKEVLKRYVAMRLPGISDERLSEMHDEIDATVDAKAEARARLRESAPVPPQSPPTAGGAPPPEASTGGGMIDLWTSPEPA